MTWILLIVGICLVACVIKIVKSAETYDKEMHETLYKDKLCSWTHIEIMAGYYLAAIVVGFIAFILLLISVVLISRNLIG